MEDFAGGMNVDDNPLDGEPSLPSSLLYTLWPYFSSDVHNLG